MKHSMAILLLIILALVALPTNAAILDPSVFEKKSSYYTTELRDGIYHIDMKESIGELRYYKDLLRGLSLLTEQDTVVLHMANYGGSVFTGAALFNALLATKAKTIAIIDGPSFSMGAMLPCAAERIIIPTHSFLMYHTWSGGISGKASDSKSMMDAVDRLTKGMLQQCTYHGILTDDDIREIMEGKDKYVFPGDLK